MQPIMSFITIVIHIVSKCSLNCQPFPPKSNICGQNTRLTVLYDSSLDDYQGIFWIGDSSGVQLPAFIFSSKIFSLKFKAGKGQQTGWWSSYNKLLFVVSDAIGGIYFVEVHCKKGHSQVLHSGVGHYWPYQTNISFIVLYRKIFWVSDLTWSFGNIVGLKYSL